MGVLILCVQENDLERQITSDTLREEGFGVVEAANPTTALQSITSHAFDIAITDLFLPQIPDGLRFISVASRRVPIAVLSVPVSDGAAMEVYKAGARKFITKPCERNELIDTIRKLVAEGTDHQPLITPGFHPCVSAALVAASSEIPVLVVGETGTGKELLVRMIHERSSRRSQPLVSITSAIPESLSDVELFGSESRSQVQKVGLIEQADKSILFVDEIADLSIEQQAIISRIIRDQRIFRVGGSKAIPVDIRMVCSTNRNLAKEVEAGRFLEDLFFQISSLIVTVPPLRSRRSDIPLLANHWREKFAAEAKRTVVISHAAMEMLAGHSWPGNVRQLFSVLERAALFADRRVAIVTITPKELPPELFPSGC